MQLVSWRVLFTVSVRKMISWRRCTELVNVLQNSTLTVIDLVLAPLKSRTLKIDKRMAVLSSNCREGLVSYQPLVPYLLRKFICATLYNSTKKVLT